MPKVMSIFIDVFVIAGVFASASSAATFNVTSTSTTMDINPGDGICDDGTGRCTLRAAIMEANALPGADTINLAAGETYTLSDPVSPSLAGLPGITSTITINGNGATIKRSAAVGTPLFQIVVVDHGDLTLKDVTISGGATDDGGFGGGLNSSYGTTTIIRSTISGNRAGNGGGIYNMNGTMIIINSTISGNKTTSGGYGGGGILNLASYGVAKITLINSSVIENQADGQQFQGRGDAIAAAFSAPGDITVKNSILASPTQGLGDDCSSVVFTSLGHNLASDNSCGLFGIGDLNNTNPMLGPLSANGGPTTTHALLAGSPAIDSVPASACTDTGGAPIVTDQRGYSRPQGAACDVGAFELVASSAVSAPPELFWGTPVPPGKATGWPNIVWFDLDGIPGPSPLAATPPVPISYGAWSSEGTPTWMDAVQAPGQPAVLLVSTSGYSGALRAFRIDGSSFTACGSYPLGVIAGENGGIRVASSGAYALSVWGSPSTGSPGNNQLWKFPMNLTATGDCFTGSPTSIDVSSNPMVRMVDFNPVNPQEAVVSGYSNIVTFVNPDSGVTTCNVPLNNPGFSLTRIEARYRPDGTEVWAASYDGRQIAVIRPPGVAGGCTVAQFITGFGSLDFLHGSIFHPDPNVPVYYVNSYPGGNIFALDTNARSINNGIHIATPAGAMAVTRGPAYLLEVPVYGCCPQYGYTNTYDVSTLSKASNPWPNLIGAHASTVDMQAVATLRSVARSMVPDLTLTKSHIGAGFSQGQQGAQYTLTVANGGTGGTTGTITVSDNLPAGLSFVSGTGPGWSCGAVGQAVTCTSTTPIPATGASSLTLNVSVSQTAPANLSNTATVSCACAESNMGNNVSNTDSVNVLALQTINFPSIPNRLLSDPPFAISASASSGLTVGFASLTTSICTISASTVTLIGAGQCTIQATQAGNSTFLAASPVNRSFNVSQNHPPVANSQSIATPGNAPLSITLTASDADNDPLTFAIATQPAHGNLTGAPPNIVYTPNLNYTGGDSFKFSVNDGQVSSIPGTVSITVFDNTPPVIIPTTTPSPNANGWNNASAMLSWSATDPESGISNSTGCGGTSLTAETAGTTVSCSATNGVGLPLTVSVTVKIDRTAPTLTFGSQTPAANAAGWNNVDVSIPFTSADNLSGVASASAASPLVFSADGSALSSTITVTDKAGNTATIASPIVKIDKTPPVIAPASRTPANVNGWNNGNVALNWSCSDSLSGAVQATVSQTVSTEGANQTATGTCMDKAGNSASNTQSGINIDKTPPVLTMPISVTANATGPSGAAVVYAASAADALDPSPALTCAPASGSVFPIGATVTVCQAMDAAGNKVSGSFQVVVRSALDQTNDVISLLNSFNLGPSSNGLMAKLNSIQSKLQKGNVNPACNDLTAFANEVSAQTGKLLTAAQADQLNRAANQIRVVLGCGK